MMRATKRSLSALAVLPLLMLVAGCGGQSAEVTALRQQLLLASEPADVSTIEEAKSQLEGGAKVTIVGRVDLTSQAAQAKSSTSFMVKEILESDHDHGAGQDASDCPFCKHKAAKAPKAAVQFVDQAGKVLPHDPVELFGIQSGDTVVVRGSGELIEELNLLNVTAEGIYVRQP